MSNMNHDSSGSTYGNNQNSRNVEDNEINKNDKDDDFSSMPRKNPQDQKGTFNPSAPNNPPGGPDEQQVKPGQQGPHTS